jgi:hypothetical protein
VDSSGRETNDGWESQQGSKVRDPQSIGTWGQFSSLGSGEHSTQRPREQLQAGASCYSLPGFGTRCKALPNKDHTTCGKERVIEIQTAGLSL